MSSAHAIFGITVVYKWPNSDRNVMAIDRNTQVLSQSGTWLCGGDMDCGEEPGNIMVGRPAGVSLSLCCDGSLRFFLPEAGEQRSRYRSLRIWPCAEGCVLVVEHTSSDLQHTFWL